MLVDQPCLFFWKQFAQIWPKAKIILTMRDNTDVWWRSAKERVLFFLFENQKPSLFREFFKNLSKKNFWSKNNAFFACLICRKKVRYENQDPGINKRPPSGVGRFSVKIIGAPMHDSKRVIVFRGLNFHAIQFRF